MNDCTDYWCEQHGKANGKCDHCQKKESVKDSPELRVILQRRAVSNMELGRVSGKDREQKR